MNRFSKEVFPTPCAPRTTIFAGDSQHRDFIFLALEMANIPSRSCMTICCGALLNQRRAVHSPEIRMLANHDHEAGPAYAPSVAAEEQQQGAVERLARMKGLDSMER